jgi:hypothetical protein
VNSASDSVKDPMDRYHREPTLAEVLSDPVTLAVMDADGVDRYDLAATLSQMAANATAWSSREKKAISRQRHCQSGHHRSQARRRGRTFGKHDEGLQRADVEE